MINQLPETKSLFIFMGVSGCGKTTLAQAFAKQNNIDFYDADDFHSTKAKIHMQSGQALTDDMRKPWIDRIIHKLNNVLESTSSCALAYSGLRSEQRQTFLNVNAKVFYFHLTLPREEAQKRIAQRKGHFFPPNLIDSQYASLEPASPNENIIALDATLPVYQLLHKINTLISP